MPLSFKGNASKKVESDEQEQDEDGSKGKPEVDDGKPAWYKRGKASAQAVKNYEKEMQEKWEDAHRMFRFYLDEGEEARVTFVDGDLDKDGFLDILTYREHHLKDQQGNWGNFFVCTADIDPCPICEDGNDASLCGVLTIIDHRKFESKKKPGTFFEFMPRLYVAKKHTIQKLQSWAEKRDGLAGCTFDIQRIGENAPRVGSEFDFVQKDEMNELRAHFTREYEDPKTKKKKSETFFVPADYAKELNYIPAEILRDKYGFGGGHPIGHKTASMPGAKIAGSGKSAITFKGKL